MTHRALPKLAIPALFFASGAASLGYEVLFARETGLALGTSATAVAIVLAAFMGGLALGGALGDRLAQRARPLAVYGFLELLAAALATLVPIALARAGELPQGAATALVALLVLAPAIPLGATFPVVSRLGSPRLLYAANTLGAVAGTLATTFAALPALGLARTELCAISLSLATGTVALALARSSPSVPVPVPVPDPPSPPSLAPLFMAALLSGFAGLLTEIVYTRVLALVLGGTAYAFGTMLATALAGIGLGSLAAVPIRASAPRAGAAMAITGALGLAVMFVVPDLPFAFIRLFQDLGPSPALESALSAAVLLAPALSSGASFALLLGPAASRPGGLYAANTAGAIAGALLGGLLLVPALGLPLVAVVAIGSSLVGAALCSSHPNVSAARLVPRVAAALVLFALAAAARPAWPPSRLATGAFSYVTTLPEGITRGVFESQFEPGRIELLFARDGRTSTVTVERFPASNAVYLKNNGKVDGSAPIDPEKPSKADMRTQRLLAWAPLALHGSARRALVIGLGGGVTAGTALEFPLERLDLCEIEPEVARAIEETRAFDVANGRPLADARTRLEIGDARRFLARAAPASYDAIASQPAEPWLTGTANLFTREFFRLGRRALTPRGVFCQWVQLYGLDRAGLSVLLATFRDVFPEVIVLRPRGARELLLVGAQDRLRIDVDAPAFSGPSGAELLGEVVASRLEVDALAAGARLNTDDGVEIEFLAARTRFVEAAEAERLARALRFSPTGEGFASIFGTLKPARALELALVAAKAGNLGTAEAFARAAGERADAHRLLGDLASLGGDPDRALLEWSAALKLDPDDRGALEHVVRARAELEAPGGAAPLPPPTAPDERRRGD